MEVVIGLSLDQDDELRMQLDACLAAIRLSLVNLQDSPDAAASVGELEQIVGQIGDALSDLDGKQ